MSAADTSTLRILPEMEQRSEEWFAARRGMVTASVMNKLVTSRAMTAAEYACPSCLAPANSPCLSRSKKVPEPIKTMHTERATLAADMAATSPRIVEPATGDEVRSLAATIAAERLSGNTEETPVTSDMWRGIDEEPRARDRYAEHHGVEVREVGFMVRDFGRFSIGYSPDGLVGERGLIEVKAPRAKGHLLTVINGEVPAYNMAQIQTGFLVSGRAWLDFIPWHGGLPMWTKRVTPDPAWQRAILAAVEAFEKTVDEMTTAYLQATDGLPATEARPNLDMD